MDERYAQGRIGDRRVGDRRDGRRLRTISSAFQLTPFIMPRPSDAVNSFTDQIEVSAIEKYLRAQRREGNEDISLLHIVIAAYVRTLAVRPALNRFIAGRYLYARNSIDIVLSSGRGGPADAGALAVTVRLLPTDTVQDVFRKINSTLDNIRADEESDQIERLSSTLIKVPRFLLRFGISILRWMDYHGWMKRGWTDRSPFHGSAVISNEGSYALPSITRSINSMGALPVSISIGRLRSVTELDKAGRLQDRKYVDYTVSFDSRIADSAYVGSAFKYFRYYLTNPEELDKAPDRVNDDTM
ncbi:MAG: hypothetical protein LUH36_04215 [Oscillospiraceae bacterium]|nr:hypothetical protein [Oscillospiraceae bacterium]